jgi:hypothetical protein
MPQPTPPAPTPKPLPPFERSFKGAIALANWLKHHNYYVSNEQDVNLSEGIIWPAFKDAVERYRAKPIYLYRLDYLYNTSISLKAPDHFAILVPFGFNTCHQRFAVCKELCHILTDDNEVRANDPIAELNSALETATHLRNAPKCQGLSPLFQPKTLSSEDFCFLLALEILIPIKERDKIVTDALIAGIRTYDIALRLRIPESLVCFYIQSGYNTAYKRVQGSQLG